MKTNKTSQQQWFSSSSSSSSTMEYLYLPNDCWERIFTFLIKDDPFDSLNTLSLVSKQFLSITDRHRFPLGIDNLISPSLPLLLSRFSNLNSLNFSCCNGNLDQLLRQMSRYSLKLTSLNLSNRSNFPADGLRAFSQKITTLTSLTCSNIAYLDSTDLLLIANCFPLLEELDLRNTSYCNSNYGSYSYGSYLDAIETLSLALSKLRKINLSGHTYINDRSLFHLFKNGKLLEEVILFNCYRNIGIERMRVEKPNSLKDFVVSSQLKSLNLSRSKRLTDESLIMFASVFLNLEMLDLSDCTRISEEGVCEIIEKCRKLTDLNLTNCSGVNLRELNFDLICEINLIGCDI